MTKLQVITLEEIKKFLEHYAVQHSPTSETLTFYAMANNTSLHFFSLEVLKGKKLEVRIGIILTREVFVNLQLLINKSVVYETTYFSVDGLKDEISNSDLVVKKFNEVVNTKHQEMIGQRRSLSLQRPFVKAFAQSSSKFGKLNLH